MELLNDFRVPVSADEAWKVLTDVERIAPMLPGAELQEVEGDEYRGVVKVKVGPITAQYKGTAKFLEQDEAAGKVVLVASGRDTRGQGNASATITATMKPAGEGTHVEVMTDLTVSGKVAQFGRGVLADVSTKLLGQFADALEADLAASGSTGGGRNAASAKNTGDAVTAREDGEDTQANRPPTEIPVTDVPKGRGGSSSDAGAASSTVRRIDGPEAEPVDLLALGGGSTLKRLLPPVGLGILVLVLVLGWRRHRSRRRR
jgi:carbon monoxide dehydrogenase subunit G